MGKIHRAPNTLHWVLLYVEEKMNSKQIKSLFHPIKLKDIKFKKDKYINVCFKSKLQAKAAMRDKFAALKKFDIRIVKDGDIEKRSFTRYVQQRKFDAQNKDFEKLSETCRIFVRHIPYELKSEELQDLFQPYGTLLECKVAYDGVLQRNRGYGFVSFQLEESAVKAMAELNGHEIGGRRLQISPADEDPEKAAQSKHDESTKSTANPPKQQRLKQHKEKLNSPRSYKWNGLLLTDEQVADILAKEMGVTKLELLVKNKHNNKDSGPAVQLATAEVELMRVMTEFYKEHHIDTTAIARSTATIDDYVAPRPEHLNTKLLLVKNLSEQTEKELFDKSSGISLNVLQRKLILPYRVGALLHFRSSAAARTFYGAYSYKTFDDKPLLIQPIDEHAWPTPEKIQEAEADRNGDDLLESKDECGSESNKLIVKNLAFRATEGELRDLFGRYGDLVSLRLPKKGAGGHRGFAFVEYSSIADAKRAYNALKWSTHLYERRLVIDFSEN